MSKYQELVESAKNIMLQIECYQAEIARLALEACEIIRGGFKAEHESKYTLKDFATDTGVEYGALRNWVQVYRDVLVKVDLPKPTKKEWEKGQKTLVAMKDLVEEKTLRRGGYKSNIPKAQVKELYREISENPEESMAAHNALRYANMIRSTLAKIDLNTQNAALLSQLLNTLNPVTTKVADHLTKKKVR